jgi:nucleoside-diphosphate-sugar epimerase
LLKDRKIVITGGAGFIGSNLALSLFEDNEVTVIDNLLTGRYENISEIADRLRFIKADIDNLDMLKLEFESADYVLHQAALPSVQRSVVDPITTNRNNIDGTLNVLVAARDCDVKRVVFASSSSVYGDTPELPKVETFTPNPLSPYAVSKLVGEYYCKVFYGIYGLETVALRYFNVFGPRQNPDSQYAAVIPKFIKAIESGERPVMYGDGEQSRDFTYVANVVKANILACEATKAVAGKVMNIACSERISLNNLFRMMKDLLHVEIEPLYSDARPGDIKHSLADITLAKSLLKYEPEYNLKEGLKEMVENGS